MGSLDVAYHVVSDVEAEDSGSVVDEPCRVDGEGGHANVQHVVGLRRQGEGLREERRLLVLPDVVKFPLKVEETALEKHEPDYGVFLTPEQGFRYVIISLLYLQTQVYVRFRHCG